MRIVVGAHAPALRLAAPCALRAAAPRLDILDDLKYQLSNADEGTRPARDLVENPAATAYLFVLALLGGGLAYLLWSDTQVAARRDAALKEQLAAAEMLRAQGLEDEAEELVKDLKKERRAERKKKEPAPDKPKGLAADPYGVGDTGNRFERRQGRAAKREKRKKRRK